MANATVQGIRAKAKEANGKSTMIGVYCSQKLLTALDNYIKDQYDEMLRPAAVRQILALYLGQNGYLVKERESQALDS